MITSLAKMMRYALQGNRTKPIFEELAKGDLLPEQVDGYVTKFADPIVKDFFEVNVANLRALIKSESCILDIGCGSGRYLKWIRDNFDHAVLYGVDISSNSIEKYANSVLNANFAVGDFSKHNPFERGKFDLAYSITVIEYIPFFYIRDFLRNVYLALRSNGVLYLQFPQGSSVLDLVRNFEYTRYPARHLEKLLIEQGFKIESSKALVLGREFEFGHYMICSKE